jgi:hypothetical protein
MAERAGTLQWTAVPRVLALLCALALLAGCGGDDSGGGSAGNGTGTGTQTIERLPWPSGDDKTIRALRSDKKEAAVLSPSVATLRVGRNRIGFALFDVSRKQVTPDAVALYVARPDGRGLRGPFEARKESLRVKPQFRSRQTQADLDDVDSFWVASVRFPERGRYVVTALAQIDGELVSTSQFELTAGAPGAPPDVGDRAIRVHTDTPEDVGGNLEAIDTRLPPIPELHRTDLADALGRQPVVLAFATPQLCQTRVCGPVVDVLAEVKAGTEGVAFIAQEIYVDNELDKGFRRQVARWRLRTEPWTFVIDRDGRIAERFEGAVSVRELRRAVRKVAPSG